LSGCAIAPAELPNLGRSKAAILRYVDSGGYAADFATAARPAREFVAQRAAACRPGERLAAVLDVDETALSNLPHMRAMDFGYVPAEWQAWVARGEAPALAPVLDVYRAAIAGGVSVFFVSGRAESDRAGTERNLRQAGYTSFAGLVLLPAGAPPPSNAAFKSAARRRIAAQGYTIVANLGDQATDLAGGFAERTFKLPNPFYLME
jgi:acid phosphatase